MESTHLVEIDVQTLELLVGSTTVNTAGIEAMLARDGLPIMIMSIRSVENASLRDFRRRSLEGNIPEGRTNLVTLRKLSASRWSRFCAGGQRPRRGKGESNLHTDRSGGEPVAREENMLACMFFISRIWAF